MQLRGAQPPKSPSKSCVQYNRVALNAVLVFVGRGCHAKVFCKLRNPLRMLGLVLYPKLPAQEEVLRRTLEGAPDERKPVVCCQKCICGLMLNDRSFNAVHA